MDLQISLGKKGNAVFEGRDMGTVVFPNAELKIFLTAKKEVRAKRRYQEILEKFPKETPIFEDILNQISQRDEKDSTRLNSPLTKAKDAYVIDSTLLSVDQVIEKILILFDNI